MVLFFDVFIPTSFPAPYPSRYPSPLCSNTATKITTPDWKITEVEAFASGKKIGLFGSYGWGDGQWMRDWEDRMKAAGATVVGGEGVICQETPDDEALENCKALGKELAALA